MTNVIAETKAFYQQRGVDIEPILSSEGFLRTRLFDDATKQLIDVKVIEAVDDSGEKIIVNDDLKQQYLALTRNVTKLYKCKCMTSKSYSVLKNSMKIYVDTNLQNYCS